ncbi:hypothetical protein [Rubritalea sp.]|uniref:hypothetical protein n=1 Tax=Rubritalea sp. TaxID=2109375 RepID=UPI0032423E5A
MEEEAKIKTVRVRINVDDGEPPRTRTAEIIHELITYTKKMIPFSSKEEAKRSKQK